MTLSYLKQRTDNANSVNHDTDGNQTFQMTPGELELLAMTEASINSDEKFLLAFEAGVLNELEKLNKKTQATYTKTRTGDFLLTMPLCYLLLRYFKKHRNVIILKDFNIEDQFMP